MFRTPLLAALAAVLLSGTAFAQSSYDRSGPNASSAPRDLSDSARSVPDYDADEAPPPSASRYDNRQDARQARTSAEDARSRDMFCRRDAAARTGYTTPGEAASNEQAKGTIGGTLGGAALGAIIGGAAGNAGTGAAIGAGAGLLAGTAVGSSNAREAAADVRAAYSDAYYDCMHEAGLSAPVDAGYGYDDVPPPPPAYAYGPPPPPVYYRPYGYPYYPYYYGPTYYGPSVGLSFGFGGGHHWGGGRHWGGHRGHR